ncbi:MAG TPA: tetratricopeptide repeat protein [Burkholderiales bacterium]|nr:tetratricopeptide repeat protein [Burkholderiales bacterium]
MEQRLQDLVRRDEEEIDLAEAALLVALHACPRLDVGHYLARIDEFGAGLRERIAPDAPATRRIEALNRYLFGELGFSPNRDDYYDPRNSFLHEVIDRRIGIPITLSVLYMEVGRRIGLSLQGVGFPGHFLVKCAVGEAMVVLDPYGGGLSLGIAELQERLRASRGGEVSRAIIASLLVAAGKKDILARMLRNLKAIYLREQALEKALAILDALVAAVPADAAERRDRGMLYQQLDCFGAAADDFEHYLARVPGAADADDIRQRVVELRGRAARLN